MDIGVDFVGAIAAANGWTRERAERVDVEYRRFLLLASAFPGRLAASPDVEAAGREHRSHVARASREAPDAVRVLSEHRAVEMPDAPDAASYRLTLDAYERVFGTPPPAEVLPRTSAPKAEEQGPGTTGDVGAWADAAAECDGHSACGVD